MITYPDKPWNDGQTFSPSTGVVATYSESKNAWSFTRSGGNVSTQDVQSLNRRPPDENIDAARSLFEETTPPDAENITTQQDINWYLYDLINSKL